MSNELTAGGFTIQLADEDIAFYRMVVAAREEEAAAWKGVMDALRVYVATAAQRSQWSRLVAATEYEYGRNEYARAVADDVAHVIEGVLDEITEAVA